MSRRRNRNKDKEKKPAEVRTTSLAELRQEQDRVLARAAAYLWLAEQAQEGLLGTDYGRPTLQMERPDGSLAEFDPMLAEEMVMDLMERAHAAREEARVLGQARLSVETPAASSSQPSPSFEQEHTLVLRKLEKERVVSVQASKDIKTSKAVKDNGIEHTGGIEKAGGGRNGKTVRSAESLMTEVPGGIA